MEADFSGYATKAMLKCSDGRTIMPEAFAHQDKMQVPLVWMHGHKDPENLLGHALLEARPDGMWVEAFFNETAKAQHMRLAVEHKDINMLSIWANNLKEKAGNVFHGMIREVSLVLAGANPGALIENVHLRHSDGDVEILEDDFIIYGDIELVHSDEGKDKPVPETETKTENQKVYETLSEEQKALFHTMLNTVLNGEEETIEHDDKVGDKTLQEVYMTLNPEQQNLVKMLIGMTAQVDASAEHNDKGGAPTEDKPNNKPSDKTEPKKGTKVDSELKHNIFEDQEDAPKNGPRPKKTLSHADMQGIMTEANKRGSLKDAVESYALAHGIDDIDVLFPDAKAISNTPEFLQRRTEWVQVWLGGTRKTPFSVIKTVSADITMEEARAKGYIKGTMKREEFFSVAKRTTGPVTVYKKQKLDRDDIVDITDFDVVAWVKAEMRLMLDEEIARAGLIGDGRDIASDDKINEQNIRPVAKDHELYVTTLYVNLVDSNSSIQEFIDEVIANRYKYKGSGQPIMFTTEQVIAKFLLLRDQVGRRIYKSLDELASELRVSRIVPVEVMEDEEDLLAILVNPADYNYGATAGGEVTTFEDFDIDFNQQKYLIETRCSGSLVRLKSAIVIRQATGTLVAPNAPAFDGSAVTITNQTGVVYKNADTDAVMNNAGSPYAVAEGDTLNVHAEPASGYYFEDSDGDDWSFTNNG